MQLPSPNNVRLNIRSRMLLLCLGVAAPLMAIGCFSLLKEYRTLKSEAQRATTFQVAISARTLNQWLSAQSEAVRALTTVPALQVPKIDIAQKILNTELKSHTGWTEMTLFTADGTVVVSTVEGAAKTAGSASSKLTTGQFIKKIVTSGRTQVSQYHSSDAIQTGHPGRISNL